MEQRAIAILCDPLYRGFGPTLTAEYLEERHEITVSKETMRHCGGLPREARHYGLYGGVQPGQEHLTATVTATRAEIRVQYGVMRTRPLPQVEQNTTLRTPVYCTSSGYEPEGRQFESVRAHHKNHSITYAEYRAALKKARASA